MTPLTTSTAFPPTASFAEETIATFASVIVPAISSPQLNAVFIASIVGLAFSEVKEHSSTAFYITEFAFSSAISETNPRSSVAVVSRQKSALASVIDSSQKHSTSSTHPGSVSPAKLTTTQIV